MFVKLNLEAVEEEVVRIISKEMKNNETGIKWHGKYGKMGQFLSLFKSLS